LCAIRICFDIAIEDQAVICMLAAGSGVGYKAFTLVPNYCFTDEDSTKMPPLLSILWEGPQTGVVRLFRLTPLSRPAESKRWAMPITVFLTDDKEVMRSSIRLLLDSDPEIRMVGEAANFQQTIQRATDLKPQIVVMDVHMPDDSSVNPREVKSLLNTLGSRLIAMSFWNDQNTQAFAQSLGAVTLLDKMRLATELIPAIKDATTKQRTASV